MWWRPVSGGGCSMQIWQGVVPCCSLRPQLWKVFRTVIVAPPFSTGIFCRTILPLAGTSRHAGCRHVSCPRSRSNIVLWQRHLAGFVIMWWRPVSGGGCSMQIWQGVVLLLVAAAPVVEGLSCNAGPEEIRLFHVDLLTNSMQAGILCTQVRKLARPSSPGPVW